MRDTKRLPRSVVKKTKKYERKKNYKLNLYRNFYYVFPREFRTNDHFLIFFDSSKDTQRFFPLQLVSFFGSYLG